MRRAGAEPLRRIAYLATDVYGGRGGIALYNRDVLEALIEANAATRVITLPRIAGDGAHNIPARVDWRSAAAVSNIAYLQELARVAVTERPLDLIYCAHVNLLPLAAMLKRLTGAPLLLAIYGTDAWVPFARRQSLKALAKVDHVLSISRFTADRFRAWSNFPDALMSVVPNAIRPADFGLAAKRPDLVDRYGLRERDVVLLLGRMDALEGQKGFDELIDAFADVRRQRPNTALLLAGDGTDKARLEAKVAALGLGNDVVFTGFIAETEKADHYRLADAYVMPSAQEGFGFVLLEAMACGVPSVASASDGGREAVRDGTIGQLVDPLDHNAIVTATLRALDMPKLVPAGLDYFRFEHFVDRVAATVRATVTGSAGQ